MTAPLKPSPPDSSRRTTGRTRQPPSGTTLTMPRSLPPNMPMVSGKAAIQDFWKFAMEMGVHLNLEAVELVVDGSTAYERGVATMTTRSGAGETKISKGKYVTVMRRQSDGSWKLVLDIWNSDPA